MNTSEGMTRIYINKIRYLAKKRAFDMIGAILTRRQNLVGIVANCTSCVDMNPKIIDLWAKSLSDECLLSLCNRYAAQGADRKLAAYMVCNPELKFPRTDVDISELCSCPGVLDVIISQPNNLKKLNQFQTWKVDIITETLCDDTPDRLKWVVNYLSEHISKNTIKRIIKESCHYARTEVVFEYMIQLGVFPTIKCLYERIWSCSNVYHSISKYGSCDILETDVTKQNRIGGGLQYLIEYCFRNNLMRRSDCKRIVVDYLVNCPPITQEIDKSLIYRIFDKIGPDMKQIFVNAVDGFWCTNSSPETTIRTNMTIVYMLDYGIQVESILDNKRKRWRITTDVRNLMYATCMHMQMERSRE